MRAKQAGREPEGMDAATAALFPAEFEESALGLIPKRWRAATLAEHVEAERGLSYKGAGLCSADEGLPMHNLNSILEGGGYKYAGLKFYKGDFKDRHVAIAGDIIVTTDSDGTYKFSTIPAMLEHLKGNVSIVTASPYHPNGEVVGVPGYRILLSRGSSMLYRILLSWKVHTYTALYRAYRREVIDRIPFAADDFLGGTELMVKAMLKGYQVDEFPAALHRRMFGVSKAKLMKTIMSHLNFQARLVLHRLHLRSMFAD